MNERDIQWLEEHLAEKGFPPLRKAYQVCHRCKGEGTLGGWPGAFTESDRAEWSDEDYDDYMNTRRTCEDCQGNRVVMEIDEAEYERPEVAAYCKEVYDSYAADRSEAIAFGYY